MRRAILVAACLLLTSPAAACQETRTPTQIGAQWFRPSGQEEKAACVIRRESGGDPSQRTGSSYGLFQINSVHRGEFESLTGKPFFDGIYNPDLNAQFAVWLWSREGWRPWIATEPRCR